jgi:hypothetical protein
VEAQAVAMELAAAEVQHQVAMLIPADNLDFMVEFPLTTMAAWLAIRQTY